MSSPSSDPNKFISDDLINDPKFLAEAKKYRFERISTWSNHLPGGTLWAGVVGLYVAPYAPSQESLAPYHETFIAWGRGQNPKDKLPDIFFIATFGRDSEGVGRVRVYIALSIEEAVKISSPTANYTTWCTKYTFFPTYVCHSRAGTLKYTESAQCYWLKLNTPLTFNQLKKMVDDCKVPEKDYSVTENNCHDFAQEMMKKSGDGTWQ